MSTGGKAEEDEANMAARPMLDCCSSWISELADRMGMHGLLLRELLERGEADTLAVELTKKDLMFVASHLSQSFCKPCSRSGRKQDLAERIVDFREDLRRQQGHGQRFQLLSGVSSAGEDDDAMLQQMLAATAFASLQATSAPMGMAQWCDHQTGHQVVLPGAPIPGFVPLAIGGVQGVPRGGPWQMNSVHAMQGVLQHGNAAWGPDSVAESSAMHAMQGCVQRGSAAWGSDRVAESSSVTTTAPKRALKAEKTDPALCIHPWEAPAVTQLMEMSFSRKDAIKGLRNTGFKQGDDPESAADIAMTWLVSRIEQMDESRKQDAVALVSESDRDLEWTRRREDEDKLVNGDESKCVLSSLRFQESVLLGGSKLPEKTKNGCRIRGSCRIKAAARLMEFLDADFVASTRRRLVTLVLLEQKCIKWYGDAAMCFLCRCADEIDSNGGQLAALDADSVDVYSARDFDSEGEWSLLRKELDRLLKRLQDSVYLTGGGCPEAFCEAYRLESTDDATDFDDVEMIPVSQQKDGSQLIVLSSDDEDEAHEEEVEGSSLEHDNCEVKSGQEDTHVVGELDPHGRVETEPVATAPVAYQETGVQEQGNVARSPSKKRGSLEPQLPQNTGETTKRRKTTTPRRNPAEEQIIDLMDSSDDGGVW